MKLLFRSVLVMVLGAVLMSAAFAQVKVVPQIAKNGKTEFKVSVTGDDLYSLRQAMGAVSGKLTFDLSNVSLSQRGTVALDAIVTDAEQPSLPSFYEGLRLDETRTTLLSMSNTWQKLDVRMKKWESSDRRLKFACSHTPVLPMPTGYSCGFRLKLR